MHVARSEVGAATVRRRRRTRSVRRCDLAIARLTVSGRAEAAAGVPGLAWRSPTAKPGLGGAATEPRQRLSGALQTVQGGLAMCGVLCVTYHIW